MPVVTPGPLRYSDTIETGIGILDTIMKLDIGLRTLALLAFVAASTIAIVRPELILGAAASGLPAINTVLLVGRA
jgi:hypothetical protein